MDTKISDPSPVSSIASDEDPSDDRSSTSDKDPPDNRSEIADDLDNIHVSATTEIDTETKTLQGKMQDIHDTVLNHENGWNQAKTTLLICKINSEASPVIIENIPYSEGNKHAEDLLIDALNKKDISSMTTITIYINNSPCSKMPYKCAGKLIKFLNENPKIILIMYVTSLYNIRRVSCIGENHYAWVNEADHEANFTGLKNLMEHNRCVVSAFSKAVWSELLNIVPVSEVFKSRLLHDYSTKLNGNDRSREDEDNRIRSDLVCIRFIPCVFQQPVNF